MPFWIATKRIDDGDAWFDRALRTPDVGAAVLARALHDHGYLVFWAGRYELAEQRFEQSLAVAEHEGDASLQALALAGLGRVALNAEAPRAVRLLRQAEKDRRARRRRSGPVGRAARARRGPADDR